jgi:zinc/manganese transport system substrate-binding protein
VVAYHRSLTYLLDWLGLSEAATLEPKPGIPPDPAHVADVLRTMRSTGAGVITEEEYYPDRTAQTLAGLAKAKVVTIQGGPRFDQGQSYLDWVKGMAEKIHGAL